MTDQVSPPGSKEAVKWSDWDYSGNMAAPYWWIGPVLITWQWRWYTNYRLPRKISVSWLPD